MAQPLPRELLDVLACPKCRQGVVQDGDAIQCQNPACRLRYPIRNGIPIMLVDEAVPADGKAAVALKH
jgi:uncharacterized protein